MDGSFNIRNVEFNKHIQAIVYFYSRVVIRKLSNNCLQLFRKLEKAYKTLIKTNADLQFLIFCLNNQMLPNFVNFKLYDVTAQHDESTIKFKRQLLEREIEKKKEEHRNETKDLGKLTVIFRQLTRGLHFYSSLRYLQRVGTQYDSDITLRHTRKLQSLYGDKIFLPKNKDNIFNLSNYQLNTSETRLLNKGLNFCLQKPFNAINRKIQTEKLFFEICNYEFKQQLNINNKEDLKIKLKNFAIQPPRNRNKKDNIDIEERAAIKALRNNKDIVIQRPDKGNGVVIMNSEYYNNELQKILQDNSKFALTDNNQTT